MEKEETYYVHKMNDLMEIRRALHVLNEKESVHAELYDLQSKKNGVFPSETVEDRAAKDFRNLARNGASTGRVREPEA